jgi:hypothetical protein
MIEKEKENPRTSRSPKEGVTRRANRRNVER